MDVKIRHWTVKEGTRVPEETMDLIVVIICTTVYIYIGHQITALNTACSCTTHAQCDDIK